MIKIIDFGTADDEEEKEKQNEMEIFLHCIFLLLLNNNQLNF